MLEKRFEEIYGTKVEHLYFAPGRVNLIGEHIDYNGGRVFPCALSFGTYLLSLIHIFVYGCFGRLLYASDELG